MDITVNPGDIIIAPPGLQDPRFTRSVIMITHETRQGTFGLCLNRLTENMVNDISDEVGTSINPNQPMFWGGPVNPQTVWMLHSHTWSLPQTVGIDGSWAMTSNRQMFHELAQGNWPEQFRITFGFTSWAPGQLEAELEGSEPRSINSSWLIWRNPDPDLLLDVAVNDLWRVATEQCGHQAVQGWLI